MRTALLLGLTLLPFAAFAETQTTIRGYVTPADPVVQHSHETVKLIGEDGTKYELLVEPDSYHTLLDRKLAGRLWEISGHRREGGKFEVRQLFTIVDGVRHKVTYYCEICHIVSYRPGQCMCCQEEVELREDIYPQP